MLIYQRVVYIGEAKFFGSTIPTYSNSWMMENRLKHVPMDIDKHV